MVCEEPAVADAELPIDAPCGFEFILETGAALNEDGMFVPCKTGVSRGDVAIGSSNGKLSSADVCDWGEVVGLVPMNIYWIPRPRLVWWLSLPQPLEWLPLIPKTIFKSIQTL